MAEVTSKYPKSPKSIAVDVTRRDVINGLLSPKQMTTQSMLSDILGGYILRLGYSSAHISGIMVQLFTRGKVEVHFRDYVERLELVNQSDRLLAAQAMTMLDDFVRNLTDDHEKARMFSQTQRIVVQFPTSTLPNRN